MDIATTVLVGAPTRSRAQEKVIHRPDVAADLPAAGGWQGTVFNPLLKVADDVIIAHDDTVERSY